MSPEIAELSSIEESPFISGADPFLSLSRLVN
jgi:hypothetical protein